MLYIKFNILNNNKFTDFQKLYHHMREIRKSDFEFEKEDLPEIDWNNMTQEEIDAILDENVTEIKRYKKFIPNYANIFLESYLLFDNNRVKICDQDVTSLLNYLEYGFEVNLDKLERLNKNTGLVKFSTGNFPFGGMERFLMVLKGFELIPLECYNGFTIYKFNWVSEFDHDAIELPRKTKAYLDGKNIQKQNFLRKIASFLKIKMSISSKNSY